jgi:DNA-binding Lrp family transcriptional regulator
MIEETDRRIVGYLRRNARVSLTEVAKDVGLPVSTVYDRMRRIERTHLSRHASLLDMKDYARMAVVLRLEPQRRAAVLEFLKKHENVNSLYRINHGFDCIAELVFPSMVRLHDFVRDLNTGFGVLECHTYAIVDDLKREEFVP